MSNNNSNKPKTDTSGLAKTLKLKAGAKVMLTCNTDIRDHRINGQMRIVNYFELIENVVSIAFIEFEDVDGDVNLILSNRLARKNNWVPKKGLTRQ